MDPGATADPTAPSTLRKRPISVDTSRRGGGDGASREPARRPERGPSEARPEGEREEEGSMAAPAAARGGDLEAGEPMSPAGRLFRETHFNCYIVAAIGLGAAVDLAAARAGLEATLVRHPRFSSIQVPHRPSSQLRTRASSADAESVPCSFGSVDLSHDARAWCPSLRSCFGCCHSSPFFFHPDG